MRDKRRIVVPFPLNRAQDNQAVREGPDERAEHELRRPVAREAVQQPGAEVLRRDGERHNRDGERNGHHGDDGSGHRGEQRARPVRPAAVEPAGECVDAPRVPVELGKRDGQEDGRQGHH